MGILTNAGRQKILAATPLNPVNIKYMAFGTGQGVPSQAQTALKSEVYRAAASPARKDIDNPLNLIIQGSIPANFPVGEGVTLYEVGLFDSDGVLIAVSSLDDGSGKGQYKPASASGVLATRFTFDFVFTVANESDYDLIINDNTEYDHRNLTHRDDADSHPIGAIVGLQDELDDLSVHNNLSGRDSGDAHPISSITGLETNLENKDTQIQDIKNDRDATRATKTISSDYTVLPTDGGVIKIDASAGNIVISMAKSTAHVSKELVLVRIDSSANTVTLNPASGDLFCGEGFSWPLALLKKYECFIFKASIDAWYGVRGLVNSISKDESTGKYNLVNNGTIVDQVVLRGDIATGSAPTFSCRAWGDYDAVNGSLRAGGNIKSITKNGAQLDVVFTTAMPSANYAVTTSSSARADAGSLNVIDGTKSATGFSLRANYGGDNTLGSYLASYSSFAVFC